MRNERRDSRRLREREACGVVPAVLKQSPQEAAETLYEATQQPEDAGQKATHRAAKAAKNAHPTTLSYRAAGEVVPPRPGELRLGSMEASWKRQTAAGGSRGQQRRSPIAL